jgi:hypothetical protein
MKQLFKSIAKRAVRPLLHDTASIATRQGVIEALYTEEMQKAMIHALTTDKMKSLMWHLASEGAMDQVSRWLDPLSGGSRVDKGTQILLSLKYQELVRNKLPLPSFDDVGFRSFSQFNEDGILLFIFSLIGMTNRRSVEMCAGNGYESISANWIVHHGFDALLVDGDHGNLAAMWKFYTTRFDTFDHPPRCVCTWIESDNVDELIRSNGFSGELDLLTIDMDGIDYWILNAIHCVQPRVIVVEYHSGWLADEPMTIPDIKGFRCTTEKPAFCSGSLAAFNKLLKGRGYRLVGCNRNRLNAFFVKNGLGDDVLPEVSVESCLDHPKLTWFRKEFRPHMLKQTDWVRV